MHEVEEKSVRCFVATISDTRTVETDKSGKLIRQYLEDNHHVCVTHRIIKDEETLIKEAIETQLKNNTIDAILLTGGTGISKRDVTIEVVQSIIEKEIQGFGEIFRMISYLEDIGARAIMSRAIAGTVGEKVIFAMPGSSGAVKLAMEKIILQELSHIVHELHK